MKELPKYSFIAEYRGELLSYDEGEIVEEMYERKSEEGKQFGSFLYFFEEYW